MPVLPTPLSAFYQPRRQWLVGGPDEGGLALLPQFGAAGGRTLRPPNSYVLVFKQAGARKALLIDAPLRHALPGVRGLREEGVEIVGCLLTHADLAVRGDAYDALAAEFGLPFFLHPEDRHDPRVQGLLTEWEDPVEACEPGGPLAELPVEALHWPGRTPGSVMLHTPKFGGVLLAGDSVIAPGPMQPDDAPPLARPPAPPPPFSPTDDEVCDAWRTLLARWETDGAPRTLAPLHGAIHVDADVPALVRGMLNTAPDMTGVRDTA
ncbi:MBL fold metallo-hydrolase [Alienimonas californiensis]|uniref:MBL fold metallo-hydrolase n=1 Tax=Alienimonas californiensis TaxID=2527989 RepID=UPI0011A4E1DB|nr:MBL fold metallo-hydrolase [Alienimonas californiensis]